MHFVICAVCEDDLKCIKCKNTRHWKLQQGQALSYNWQFTWRCERGKSPNGIWQGNIQFVHDGNRRVALNSTCKQIKNKRRKNTFFLLYKPVSRYSISISGMTVSRWCGASSNPERNDECSKIHWAARTLCEKNVSGWRFRLSSWQCTMPQSKSPKGLTFTILWS